MKGIDRIFFVGGWASYIQQEMHIQCEDSFPWNKARNIYEKIKSACLCDRVSDPFMCSSDDIYLLVDFDINTFPFFQCGTLEAALSKIDPAGSYYPYVKATVEALQSANRPTINFNGHTPIVYNKERFLQLTQAYNWEVKKGYISKSLYCNSMGIEGEFLKDRKFHWPYTESAIKRKIENAKIFSTENIAMNTEMITVMNSLYPNSYQI